MSEWRYLTLASFLQARRRQADFPGAREEGTTIDHVRAFIEQPRQPCSRHRAKKRPISDLPRRRPADSFSCRFFARIQIAFPYPALSAFALRADIFGFHPPRLPLEDAQRIALDGIGLARMRIGRIVVKIRFFGGDDANGLPASLFALPERYRFGGKVLHIPAAGRIFFQLGAHGWLAVFGKQLHGAGNDIVDVAVCRKPGIYPSDRIAHFAAHEKDAAELSGAGRAFKVGGQDALLVDADEQAVIDAGGDRRGDGWHGSQCGTGSQ